MSTDVVTKPSLTIKRRFNVRPEKVFQAWADPEKLKKWLGPGEVRCTSVEADARAGGRYRFIMQKPGAPEEHNVAGVYREVVPNEKLVFTWAWKSTPEQESLVTVTFKPDGDGTLMTLTHENFFDADARDSHNQGWTGALLKLQTYLHTADAKPHGKFVWNELNTQHVNAAQRFLGTTIGWTFEAMGMPGFTYWIIKNGDDRVGGLYDTSADERCKDAPEHWLSYTAVDDVDTRFKTALIAGAKEVRAPSDIPGVGRIAILEQPGGAKIAMITPRPM